MVEVAGTAAAGTVPAPALVAAVTADMVRLAVEGEDIFDGAPKLAGTAFSHELSCPALRAGSESRILCSGKGFAQDPRHARCILE